MTVDTHFEEEGFLLKQLTRHNYTKELQESHTVKVAPTMDHDPCDCRFLFAPEKIRRSDVGGWLGLQIFCLFLQLTLWSELTKHIYQFYDTINSNCDLHHRSAEGGGVCVGSAFSIVHQSDFVPAFNADFEQTHNFAFNVSNTSPFLVMVRPEPAGCHAHYSLEMHSGFSELRRGTMTGVFTGVVKGSIFEARDEDNQTDDFVDPEFIENLVPTSERTKEWTGTLRDVEMHRDWRKSRNYKLMIQQATAPSMKLAQQNPQCDFEASWVAFNRASIGEEGERLSFYRSIVVYSIIVTTLCIYAVVGWYGSRRLPMGLNFHYLVAAKWVMQDIPLQVVTLVYIYRWFDSAGERCQLCLFDQVHCETLSPFHPSNALLIAAVLASSLVNQLLVRAKFDRNDEDQWFAVYGARVAVGSVSVLPFTTAMVLFNNSLLSMSSLWHTLFILPCIAGWVSLVCLVCFPLAIVIDDQIEKLEEDIL